MARERLQNGTLVLTCDEPGCLAIERAGSERMGEWRKCGTKTARDTFEYFYCGDHAHRADEYLERSAALGHIV